MTKKDEAFKVVWPAIEVFPSMLTEDISFKEQAKKVLEEAAEIYAVIDDMDSDRDCWEEVDRLLEECADCVTAISNLATRAYMHWVRKRMGFYASQHINNITMRNYCEMVRGKNFRRGYYNTVNPDIGDCIDKDGDFNGKDEQRKRKAR